MNTKIVNIIIITVIIVFLFIFVYNLCTIDYFKIKSPEKPEVTKFFNDNVDSYYINLDSATKRKKNIEKQFKKQNLQINRYSAVNGREIDLDDPDYQKYLKYTKDWYKSDYNRKGHFGVFLSHLDLYDIGQRSDKDIILIFEDDCEFITDNFKQDIYDNLKNIPNDWDIILTGYHIDDDIDEVKKGNKDMKLKDGILNINYFTGLHGYLVKKSCLKKLYEGLKEHLWVIDWSISYLAADNKIKIYGIYPPILCQPAIHRISAKDIDYYYQCNTELGGMLDPDSSQVG